MALIAALALKIMEAGWDPVPARAAAWTLTLGTPVALWLLFSWLFV